MTTRLGEDVVKEGPLFTTNRNGNLNSHYQKQCGGYKKLKSPKHDLRLKFETPQST